METLQTSAAWGAVRVVPLDHDSVDVLVTGEILRSDGELLTLNITVTDATGKHWYTKEYQHKASKYSYNERMQLPKEPFQNVYNKITNDLYLFQKTLQPNQLSKIRQISELKFAKSGNAISTLLDGCLYILISSDAFGAFGVTDRDCIEFAVLKVLPGSNSKFEIPTVVSPSDNGFIAAISDSLLLR